MGNNRDNWLVMKLEGDNGTPGFALISDRHPAPATGVEALVEASGARPRKVGKSEWIDPQREDTSATRPVVKRDPGTTFAGVLSRLQRRGPA